MSSTTENQQLPNDEPQRPDGHKPPLLGFRLDTALLLAIIPATAYLLVLLFDAGYSRFFYLDAQFIRPDPFSIFYVLRTVFTTVVTVWGQTQGLLFDLPHINLVIAIRALELLATLLLFIAAWILVYARYARIENIEPAAARFLFARLMLAAAIMVFWLSSIVSPLVAVGLVFLYSVLPLLVGVFQKRKLSDWQLRVRFPETIWTPEVVRRLRYLSALIIAVSPVHYLGYESARTQQHFFVTATGPTYALLTISGDYIIACPAGIDSQTARGSSQVFNPFASAEAVFNPKRLTIRQGFKSFKLGDKDTPVFEPRDFAVVRVGDGEDSSWLDELVVL
jgi:hypothetical protein